ncbi:hypothetical protein O6H91_Y580600 [Diphasiastrum complanatum]|nr:hypothetical protein O6H91_Y015300 [Diphasiastrum complanatum]KAJ7298450.1 hypothetical protein O6H91_Y580600 [Diphasiastrum complanatum]
MEMRCGDVMPRPSFSEEGLVAFTEGVKRCLGRWTALQLAVENEWGGPRSMAKAHQLHSDVVSWMAQSRVPRYIDELESLLDDNMISLFSAEIEDGSLEEVAEQIMLLHEECLEGNYGRLELLSTSSGAKASVSANQQGGVDVDETVHEADDYPRLPLETTVEGMGIDLPSQGAAIPATSSMSYDSQTGNVKGCLTAEEVADGWQVASKGKRHNKNKKSDNQINT